MPISVRFEKTVEERLSALASLTGRTMSFYIREAVSEKLEELEDVYLAEKRLESLGSTVSMEALEQELDLEN